MSEGSQPLEVELELRIDKNLQQKSLVKVL